MKLNRLVTAALVTPLFCIMLPAQQFDAERTKQELAQVIGHYPPTLHSVVSIDPTLLTNDSFTSAYPALRDYVKAHAEIARNPAFYAGDPENAHPDDLRRDVLGGLAALTALCVAAGILVWLIRTLVDYRRWNRLSKIQMEMHTKLLDRFSANDELLAYIQSPAGSRFLESAPINIDPGPRSMGAPLSRIMWSVQAGVVLTAAGGGLMASSGLMSRATGQDLNAIGVLVISLGIGFIVSAAIAFLMSRHLGLLEGAKPNVA